MSKTQLFEVFAPLSQTRERQKRVLREKLTLGTSGLHQVRLLKEHCWRKVNQSNPGFKYSLLLSGTNHASS